MEEKFILATKRKNQKYEAEEVFDTLEACLQGIEYGDVNEHECQVWEYPSGKIYDVIPDREVDRTNYYALPNPELWQPILKVVDTDNDQVRTAYEKLA